MVEQHQLPDGKPVKLPGIVPRLSETPSATEWLGRPLGAHNAEVLERSVAVERSSGSSNSVA